MCCVDMIIPAISVYYELKCWNIVITNAIILIHRFIFFLCASVSSTLYSYTYTLYGFFLSKFRTHFFYIITKIHLICKHYMSVNIHITLYIAYRACYLFMHISVNVTCLFISSFGIRSATLGMA
jgi:hypothetical protein